MVGCRYLRLGTQHNPIQRSLPTRFTASAVAQSEPGLTGFGYNAQSKGTKKDKNVIESALVGGEPLHQRRASVVTLLLASDRVANKESSGRLIAGEERTNNGSF